MQDISANPDISKTTKTEENYHRELIDQLPPDVNDADWPRIVLKRLRMVNFAIHENVEVDLTHRDSFMKLIALVGPNGTGKTTILNAIQLLFSNFTSYSPERIRIMLQKHVRNYMHLSPEDLGKADFEVSGVFQDNKGVEYEVKITRNGVVKAHPEFIRERLTYYCFFARYDQELHLFQLKRQRWPLFQEIFSQVTGYPVEEDEPIFDGANDIRVRGLMQQYVTGFKVIKPRETILHKQCSAGERKIAKCFSTILNKEVQPQIILIDNVTDHVEIDRHLPVVANIEKCFPKSQIFVSCHSIPVQRNLPRQERLIDMRLVHASHLICDQPFRLRLYDEVKDALEKVNSLLPSHEREKLLERGATLSHLIMNETLVDPAMVVSNYTRDVNFRALCQTIGVSSQPKIINRSGS
jgi:hypothetical protein